MIFKVRCKVLYWFDEAIKNGEIVESDLDTLDQINEIDSIEPWDSDELE